MAGTTGMRAIWPDGAPDPRLPYSPVVAAGPWVFSSGFLAAEPGRGLPDACRPLPDMADSSIVPQRVQSAYVLDQLARACEAAGASFDDHSVRIYQWFTCPDQERDGGTWVGDGFTITPYLEERNRYLTHDRPASTGMGIRNLLGRDAVVEVDVILKTDTPKQQVQLDVPTALAGYSQGLVSGDWVFTAGEHATDFVGDWGATEYRGPRSGIQVDARTPSELFWYGLPVRLQTLKLLEKLEANLETCGSSMKDVVHATVYYGHPRDVPEIEEAWRQWWPEDPPARTLIPYMGIGIRDCNPEIALIALKKGAATTRTPIVADGVPEPIGHEPHAVRAGDLLFLSTQIAASRDGLCPGGRRADAFPWHGQPARAQVDWILGNVSAICEAAGTSLENVCKRQCFHTDFAWFAEAIDAWSGHFPGVRPASTTVELGGRLPVDGALLLLDLIAYCPGA